MDDRKILIPSPHYALFDTSKGNDPAVVVVNSSLKLFKERRVFPWHLNITLICEVIADKGMPSTEENQVLNQLEDSIFEKLSFGENTLFLSRITCRGVRELGIRVRDPELTNSVLQNLLSLPNPLRQWNYAMKNDPDWVMAQPVLDLLERADNMN